MANFGVSARALDMLGKQQIAGIPTATSELFKNAYDAYADNVEVDYFRKKNLFIMRDNGYGMTFDDFENKYLVVGTESKLSKKSEINPFEKEPDRPVMGEKGIGRLAVSTIGPQVLILTRAYRKDKETNEGILHKINISFINWELFGLPGLSLFDIHIPHYEIEDIPDNQFIRSLVEEVEENITALLEQGKVNELDYERIVDQLNSFDFDIKELHKSFNDLNLDNSNSVIESKVGTHYYISPVDESLSVSLDVDYNSTDNISTMQKMLIGFTNTMSGKDPIILTAFRDHKTDDETETTDLIEKTQFFTPDECALLDHHFKGVFDEYGQFEGDVTIYNESTFENHKIPWLNSNGKKTLCGPFTIDVHYLQGEERNSSLNLDAHKYLRSKCDRYGGLYLYRDDIRVLPYGVSEFDFLNFEKRRSKSAAYYFFSYRRMIGSIEISHELNNNLREKAGREGFIENKAYRQFKEILENFFIQLANDFFRVGGGPKSELWTKRKEEFDNAHKARQLREKQAKAKKEKFSELVAEFFKNKDKINRELADILSKQKIEFESLTSINDEDELARKIIEVERNGRREITRIENVYKVPPPKGFALNDDIRQNWEAFTAEWAKLTIELFHPAKKELLAMVDHYKTLYKLELNQRIRLQEAIEEISEDVEKNVTSSKKATEKIVDEVKTRVVSFTQKVMVDLEDSISEIKADFSRLDMSKLTDNELYDKRIEVETKIEDTAANYKVILEKIQNQLLSINWSDDKDGNFVTLEDINDSAIEELEELRAQITTDTELSQLGLAVGVIQHEFTSTADNIKKSIKALKAYSDVDNKFESLYLNLRANFEHLDTYLALFSPLDRRLYRKNETIPYKQILAFVLDVFDAKFQRHNIKIKPSVGFNKLSIYGCRSKLYPVFVNIIDNAVYWLKQIDDPEFDRIVRLHADENGFYISNNGPVIAELDREKIFSLGFSRKQTLHGRGRGMGLHITKDALSSVGYDICVDEPRKNSNVTFTITKKNEEIESEQ